MCSCRLGKCEIDLDPEIALDPELETMVYRIVEEALEAIEPPRTIRVHHTPDGVLVVDAQGSDNEFDSDRMRILTARVELIGGTVTASPNALSVRIWPTAVRRPAVRRAPATG
jgi:hypothetical protein